MAREPIARKLTDREPIDDSAFEKLEDYIDATIEKQDSDRENYIAVKIPEKFKSRIRDNKDEFHLLLAKYRKHWSKVDWNPMNDVIFLHK